MYRKIFTSTKKRGIQILVITACALLVIGVSVGVFSTLTKVPNVVGRSAELACYIIEEHSLIAECTEEYSDTVEKGIVISQSMEADTAAKRGSTVALAISKGPDFVTVPNVLTLTLDQATDLLLQNGLKTEYTEEYSDTVAKGIVISQSNVADTACKRGSTINLVVSAGIETREVPSLQNMTREEAEVALKQLDFKVTIQESFSDTAMKGTVISQSIAAGKTVDKGSTVQIVISKGVDLVAVPNVCGFSLDQAKKALEQRGLKTIHTLEFSDTVSKDLVISQDTESGTLLKRGTQIRLVVSAGLAPREVPNLINKTRKEAEIALEKLDLKVKMTEMFSGTIEKGHVISQSIKAGTLTPKGTTIELVISKGPDFVTVPNVCGKTYKEAFALLSAAGLTVKEEPQCSNIVPEGIVISQSSAPDSQLSRDIPISVYVSAGVANTRGTTNSNSRDFGSVTAQGDWIYFKGSNHCLYKMKKDGSEKQLLTTDYASYLNVVGEWIYFANASDSYKLYKIKINGLDKTKITNTSCYNIIVIGDWIYYRSDFVASEIYKIKTDGTQKTLISSDKCSRMCVEDDMVYYMQDSTIYRISTEGKNKSTLHPEFHGYSLTVENGVAYCIPDSISDALLSINTDGTSLQDYPEEYKTQFSLFNVSNGWIYYIKHIFFGEPIQSRTFICKMRTDGSDNEELQEIHWGSTNFYLNVIEDWIYFPNRDDNDIMYRVKTDGSVMEKCG